MLCDLIAVYSITRKLAIKSHTFSIKMFDTIQKKDNCLQNNARGNKGLCEHKTIVHMRTKSKIVHWYHQPLNTISKCDS